MADREFVNQGFMSGAYGETPFSDSGSSVVSVTLAEVPFEKAADQTIWFSGPLTLTFTIDNTGGAGELAGVTITDTLDVTMFEYVEESVVVKVNDVDIQAFNANYEAPVLTVTLTDPITTSQIVTVSFRGEKVP